MEPVIEKSAIHREDGSPLRAMFDALSVISVLAVLVGAALAVAGLSWRVRAYFSIVAVLFDIIFVYEFFARLATGRRPIPWLAGVSSILPLIAVSGPFLIAWIVGDLGSAAVRGFWLAPPPLGALTVASMLRLLRLSRPFWSGMRRSPRTRGGRARALVIAAAAGISIALLGAIASDTLLLPGSAMATSARRQRAISAIAAANGDPERMAAAEAGGAVALRADGRVLKSAAPGISPSDYAFESRGGLEAWFSTSDDLKARAMAEAIAIMACVAAAAAYCVAMRFSISSSSFDYERGVESATRRARRQTKSRLADAPAGDEELEGILGKRPR